MLPFLMTRDDFHRFKPVQLSPEFRSGFQGIGCNQGAAGICLTAYWRRLALPHKPTEIPGGRGLTQKNSPSEWRVVIPGFLPSDAYEMPCHTSNCCHPDFGRMGVRERRGPAIHNPAPTGQRESLWGNRPFSSQWKCGGD